MAKAKPKDDKPTIGLGEQVADAMNKKFKTSPFRIQHGISNDHASKVKRWVPSGCKIFDLAMSNLPDGGYPCGRITLLYGPEQSGKSLTAMHALAETQKMGGIAIYVDAERSLHQGFAEAIGINLSELNYVDINEIEPIFSGITQTVEAIRETDKDILITVVIDSLAALLGEEIDQSAFGKKGFNLSRAVAFSEGFPKITKMVSDHDVCMIITNQARQKLEKNKYESPYTQSGGQAVPHYASIIVYMTKHKSLKAMINGLERHIGRTTRAKIEKNRLGPPEVVIFFDTYFDRGIDNYAGWYDYAKAFKICGVNGKWISYTHTFKDTGEVVEFKEDGWKAFCNNVIRKYPEIADTIWMAIYEKFKTTYKANSSDYDVIIEDVEGSDD